MPRGDEMTEELKFSDRDDDSDDVGYSGGGGGGGSSYDGDDEEDGGWMTHKDDSSDLWDSADDSDEDEEEVGAVAEVVDDDDAVFPREVDRALHELELDGGRRRVVRKRQDDHARPRPGALDLPPALPRAARRNSQGAADDHARHRGTSRGA